MKDIERLLSQLAEHANVIIANPKTVEQLVKQGVGFEQVPEPTIEKTIEIHLEMAAQIAKQVPYRPFWATRTWIIYIARYGYALYSAFTVPPSRCAVPLSNTSSRSHSTRVR